jgi:hypothetical protein
LYCAIASAIVRRSNVRREIDRLALVWHARRAEHAHRDIAQQRFREVHQVADNPDTPRRTRAS